MVLRSLYRFYGDTEKCCFKFYGDTEKLGFKFYGDTEKCCFKFYGDTEKRGFKFYGDTYYTFPADPGGKNHYEIDFLIADGPKLIPVEVESSGYVAHKSLDRFCEKFSSRIKRALMLYPKDLRKEGEMIYLPVYMAALL